MASEDGIQDMRARNVLGLAVGLMVAAPIALGQKMYRCSDGKGGTVFQQERCGESAAEAEARARERERLEAEARRKKEEEERRKEATIQKARERDEAYREQLKERQEAQRKSREVEQRLMEGTSKQRSVDDGTLPAAFAQSHPGAWKEASNPEIAAAFGKNKTPGCAQYRYRQRAGGLPEYVVQCTVDKANWVTYFVWPKAQVVKGPARF